MKKTLETIKTFYIGTQKELEEKVSETYSFVWIAESIPFVATVATLLSGDYKIAALTSPFAIDYASRVCRGAIQIFKNSPAHTPNIIGTIREYRGKKNLEGKLEE